MEPAPDAGRPRSSFAVLRDLYLTPSEAFADLSATPRAATGLAGFAALQAAFMAVWMSRMDLLEFVRAQAEASGGAAPRGAMDPSSVGTIKWMISLSGVSASVLSLLVLAALLLFVFNFLLGGSASYRQCVTVAGWTALATGLVTLPLVLAVMALRGEWSVPPDQLVQANLGLLFERGASGPFLASLARSIDLFWFWMMFLIAVGMAQAARVSTRSAALTLGALWLVFVLVKAGLAAAF